MADSSARKLAYEPKIKSDTGRRARTLVQDPKKVPFNGVEKGLIILGSIITLGMMTFLVSSSISANSASHELADVQERVAQGQDRTTTLRQEIGALSSNQQLKKVIRKQGLTLNDQNIRTIR